MEIKLYKKRTHTGFLGKMKQEVKVLSNMHHILEKIDRDGFLNVVHSTFI